MILIELQDKMKKVLLIFCNQSVRLDAVSVCIIALAIIFPGFLLLHKLNRQLNGITFLDVLFFFPISVFNMVMSGMSTKKIGCVSTWMSIL